jgi:hypothetical protein
MPDKAVRVTSRYPKGHSTVFFDFAKAHGFTLEADRYHPDTLVLQAVGCYGDYTARYGDPVEAEADLAGLNLMLADRHTIPAASSVPALASTQPPIALGHAKRRGWGWKGTMAGLALGVLGSMVATRTLGTNTAADRLALRAADVARALPPDDSLSQGQGAAWPYVPLPSRPILPSPAAVQQPASPAALPSQPRLQPPSPPRPSASNFGLQP